MAEAGRAEGSGAGGAAIGEQARGAHPGGIPALGAQAQGGDRRAFRSLGLIGAIAAGKSEAARLLAARGAQVVDADRVAHALYAESRPLREAIAAEFGSGVLAADGSLDRRALGARVFADAAAMTRLEALVHPPLLARLEQEMHAAGSGHEIVVLEAALLPRWPALCRRLDGVLAVTAPAELRLERLCRRNGLSPEAARERLAAEVPEALLRATATRVIENTGSKEALEAEIDSFWHSFTAMARSPLNTIAPMDPIPSGPDTPAPGTISAADR